MKKKYSTPQIVFDSFKLSESIATCQAVASNQADKVCPVYIKELVGPDTVLFGNDPCEWTPADLYDDVCYDVPPNLTKVFTS